MKMAVEFKENEQTFDASFDNGEELQVDFGEVQIVGVEGGSETGTTDHSQLTNRDKAGQHPMSAITGLVNALAGKQIAGSYLTKETDPTVPAWAKQATKPSYTANEVGADPSGSAAASLKSAMAYTDKQIAAIPTPDVSGQISAHNTAVDAHNDVRLLISGLTERLNALANSDDTTLDQMAEVVAYIKDNRELIETVTTAKVNVTDIIDNLTTNVSDRPLSAAQGVVLKGLVNSLSVLANGKLDASALTDAINVALAQAKESGEFDGAPGEPGQPGKDGSPGADGYTPQRGVDYWTEADKQEIVSDVISALPVYKGEVEVVE